MDREALVDNLLEELLYPVLVLREVHLGRPQLVNSSWNQHCF
jgi:hypothetical protein